ncbi:MAG TPA: nucleotidyltransferase, partial [Deltaproteobacteria bacterium]|nr:nucleotidyltransferase [Deltaproteobacteria bacterium]
MQNLQLLLKILIQSPVDFVLLGGFAAVLHGCNQTTRDIDICVLQTPEQLELLRETLQTLHPRFRKIRDEPSFLGFPEKFSEEQDFYLVTDLGILDIVSRVEGVGDYYDVLQN